jgi:undecaprenyl-diphosphatase
MSIQTIDTLLFTAINSGLANPIFDAIMPFLTAKGYLLLIPYLMVIFIKTLPQGRSAACRQIAYVLTMAIAVMLLADWCAYELKNAVERMRPCKALEHVHLLVGCSSSSSFPSNHATNSFAVAFIFTLISRHQPLGLIKWYPLGIATLIAISRPYVGVHYPSDIIAGALLGIIISSLFWQAIQSARTWYRTHPQETILIVTLAILSLIRFYYIAHGPLDLSPDEAHYWEWSRRLDWSYYSKGPMIAWLIAASTALWGDTVLGVRFFAPLLSALGSIVLYRLVVRMYCRQSSYHKQAHDIALASSLLLQIVPLFAPFGVIFTIDAPFVFFWIVSLDAFWHAIEHRAEQKPYASWLWAGIAIGMGLLTKYTMAFFLVSAFLLLVFSEKRFWLKTPYPYLALAASLMTFCPVIYWNYNNHWITVLHTAGQAHIADGMQISLRSFGEFVGSQIGIVTPILICLMCAAMWRILRYPAAFTDRFIFWFTAPIILFFIVKSLQGKVQPNWAMTGYITGMIGTSARYWSCKSFFAPAGRKGRTLFLAAAIFALIVSIAAYVIPTLHVLPVAYDPTARLQGWKMLGKEVGRIAEEMGGSEKLLIMSDSYQDASALAFYIPGHPKTFCIVNGRRMNQYDLWPDVNAHAAELRNKGVYPINGIFVQYGAGQLPPTIAAAFERFEKKLVYIYDKERVIRAHTVTRCYGFKGLRQEAPLTY